jgi:hypothetical protein
MGGAEREKGCDEMTTSERDELRRLLAELVAERDAAVARAAELEIDLANSRHMRECERAVISKLMNVDDFFAKIDEANARATTAVARAEQAEARVAALEVEKERDCEYLRGILAEVDEKQNGLAVCSWCALPTNSDDESKRKHQRECEKNPLLAELTALLARLEAAERVVTLARRFLEMAVIDRQSYANNDLSKIEKELRAALEVKP